MSAATAATAAVVGDRLGGHPAGNSHVLQLGLSLPLAEQQVNGPARADLAWRAAGTLRTPAPGACGAESVS